MHRSIRLISSLSIMLFVLAGGLCVAQSLQFQDESTSPKGVQLRSLAVNARISAGFARTRLEITLYNPDYRVRGGTLVIPLPADAIVMGYSLDVNGVLVEGVPVPKARARQVYEAIQARNVDPGLVEYAQGSAFRTRVFPVQPGASRRLVLEYLSELEGARLDTWILPLRIENPLDSFSLKAVVVQPGSKPGVTFEGIEGLQIRAQVADWLVEASTRNRAIKSDLVLTIPTPTANQVLVERAGREVYFASQVQLEPPAASRPGWASGSEAKIDLYMDCSLSAADVEPEVPAAILAQLSRKLAQPLNLRLIPFRNEPEKATTFGLEPGDADALSFQLGRLAFDGGSRFDNLPAPRPGALALFFTDGMANLSPDCPDWPAGERIVLLAGRTVDADFARRLTGERGQVLKTDRASPEAIAAGMIGWKGYPVAVVESGSASDLRVTPSLAHPGVIVLSGRLASPSAVLRCAWPGDNGSAVRLTIRSGDAVDSPTARYLWAMGELRRMLQRPDASSEKALKEIGEFGMMYGIVSPGTSLLVLESLDQYLEYEIMPPASMPEWRKAWIARQGKAKQDEERALAHRLDALAGEWASRLAWWNTDFSKVPDIIAPVSAKPSISPPAAVTTTLQNSAPMTAEGQALYDRGDSSLGSEAARMMFELADRPAAPEAERRMAIQAPASPSAFGMGAGGILASKSGEPEPVGYAATIEIRPWSPNRPYLRELDAVGARNAYERYLDIRGEYTASPAFFLDVGDWFLRAGDAVLAARIWTTMADCGFDDAVIQRILAQRLTHAGALETAIVLFEQIKRSRPDEPQSLRDLALVLVRAGRYREAADLLYQVATGEWSRNQGVELIALEELNRWLDQARAQGWNTTLDPRLKENLACDLRVVMSWDTDQSDMDLWVVEPNGVKVYYSSPDSRVGGHISRDITDGYGPEQYSIKKARTGTYTISTNYFGSRNQDITGAVTVFATVYTNWGRASEKRQDLVLQLTGTKETYTIGTVTW